MQKVPGTDRLEMVFKLDTNDPSFNGLYGQVNWNSAVGVDILYSGKQVTYIPSPYPQLKGCGGLYGRYLAERSFLWDAFIKKISLIFT
jgi:hypothetical protein